MSKANFSLYSVQGQNKHIIHQNILTNLGFLFRLFVVILPILMMLLTITACKNRDNALSDEDVIFIFDTTKSNQKQMYPDAAPLSNVPIVIGELGTMVRDIVVIDEAAITHVVREWNRAYNEKNPEILSSIYADHITFNGARLTRANVIAQAQETYRSSPSDINRKIVEPSGKRTGNAQVRIEFKKLSRVGKDKIITDAFLEIERNKEGWQIIAE